eukprot:4525698-Alexandrium_andersonii.AAC.1
MWHACKWPESASDSCPVLLTGPSVLANGPFAALGIRLSVCVRRWSIRAKASPGGRSPSRPNGPDGLRCSLG